MNRSFVFVLGLALLAPAAFAQTAGKLDPGSEEQVEQNQAALDRQMQQASHDFERGERQSWIASMANLAKLRVKLAEAWHGMGMSPQKAKQIADAYDPTLAANMHRASLRGKSDQEIAAMLGDAIKQQHYSSADQLLIDYQRNKLRLDTTQTAGVN